MASTPVTANCYFTDFMEKPFAVDSKVVPALAPGESQVFEFFSMVRHEEAAQSSGLNYRATVRFSGIEGVKSNIKTKSRLERKMDEDRSRKTWSVPRDTVPKGNIKY